MRLRALRFHSSALRTTGSVSIQISSGATRRTRMSACMLKASPPSRPPERDEPDEPHESDEQRSSERLAGGISSRALT